MFIRPCECGRFLQMAIGGCWLELALTFQSSNSLFFSKSFILLFWFFYFSTFEYYRAEWIHWISHIDSFIHALKFNNNKHFKWKRSRQTNSLFAISVVSAWIATPFMGSCDSNHSVSVFIHIFFIIFEQYCRGLFSPNELSLILFKFLFDRDMNWHDY